MLDVAKWSIAPILTLLGLLATWYIFRFNNRRKKLLVEVEFSEIIDSKVSPGAHGVSVAYSGEELTDPYFVTVAIENSGHKDIPRTDFDDERPLIVDLGTKILAVLQNESRVVETNHSGERLHVAPLMLRKGEKYQVNLLVDGRPTGKVVQADILDTDVIDGPTKEERDKRVNRVTLVALIIVGVIGAFCTPFTIVGLNKADGRREALNAAVDDALAEGQSGSIGPEDGRRWDVMQSAIDASRWKGPFTDWWFAVSFWGLYACMCVMFALLAFRIARRRGWLGSRRAG